MVASCGRDSELSEALIRLLVNLTNPTLLFFREDLPKDGAGRRTYLDLVEISHTYKEAFAKALPVWEYFAARLQKILNTVSRSAMVPSEMINLFVFRTSAIGWRSRACYWNECWC